MRFEVLVTFPPHHLDGEDFRFGWSLLADALPGRWHVGRNEALPDLVQRVAPIVDARTELCVLVPDPAIIVPAGCLGVLTDALVSNAAPAVVAASPGHFPSDAPPDYLTLHGLERYAQRCLHLSPRPWTGTQPQLVVIQRALLESLFGADGAWQLPAGTLLVPGAPVHPYGDYHRSPRSEVLALLPKKVSRLLDMGGGEGLFAAEAKRLKQCEACVVEANAAAAEIASRHVDRVWQGDLLETIFDGQFDCVTALDVIEHCADTDAVLGKIRGLLAPDGTFIASIPNLGHWSVIADLLAGRWDYLPVGIACRSHLRFFTRRNIEEFWRRAGFRIAAVRPITIAAPSSFAAALEPAAAICSVALDRDSLDAYQFLVAARSR